MTYGLEARKVPADGQWILCYLVPGAGAMLGADGHDVLRFPTKKEAERFRREFERGLREIPRKKEDFIGRSKSVTSRKPPLVL